MVQVEADVVSGAPRPFQNANLFPLFELPLSLDI
jgi:hypothetical protein